MEGWMTCYYKSLTKRGKKVRKWPKKGKRKRSDLVCGQYTNVHKLGAKQDGQDFFNHKNWLNFF
jgi:hypothetical protein